MLFPCQREKTYIKNEQLRMAKAGVQKQSYMAKAGVQKQSYAIETNQASLV